MILGRSVGLKKKNHKKSWNSMPWYPRTTSWINKIHNILFNVPVFVPSFLYAVTMLISRLKELFPTLTKSLLCFFLKTPKIWVSRTTLNGVKKEDGLIALSCVRPLKVSIKTRRLFEKFSLLFMFSACTTGH